MFDMLRRIVFQMFLYRLKDLSRIVAKFTLTTQVYLNWKLFFFFVTLRTLGSNWKTLYCYEVKMEAGVNLMFVQKDCNGYRFSLTVGSTFRALARSAQDLLSARIPWCLLEVKISLNVIQRLKDLFHRESDASTPVQRQRFLCLI
jgi:hypothetical protein